MKGKKQKALSPLVATAILISAAMAGGIILYQYFTQTINNYTAEETILLTIVGQDTGTGKTMFFYTIKNTGPTPAELGSIKIYSGETLVHTINLTGTTVYAGSKVTGSSLANTPATPGMYAVVEYTINGQPVISKPVTVSLG